MNYKHQKREKTNRTETPICLSNRLYELLNPIVNPYAVLDPCCGRGNLLKPWGCKRIGVDIWYQRDIPNFIQEDFLSLKSLSIPISLVLCNPPFCMGSPSMMYPEEFLRKIVDLFGPEQKVALIVPHGFRLNQRVKSKRRKWFAGCGPKITSIMSLPLDIFPNTLFHTEILFFNIPELEPHYWY